MKPPNDMPRFGCVLDPLDEPLQKTSHYEVNRKIYELMKNAKHEDIAYYAQVDTLVLNGKPVFIDNELEDGIATYQRKESEPIKVVNIYSANKILVGPRRIEPISFIGLI